VQASTPDSIYLEEEMWFQGYRSSNNQSATKQRHQQMLDQICLLKRTFSKYYEGRDESHAVAHVVSVAKNALTLIMREEKKAKKMIKQKDVSVILASAILHDSYDHKYVTDE
jgi:HD superfamily phosphodiesterase